MRRTKLRGHLETPAVNPPYNAHDPSKRLIRPEHQGLQLAHRMIVNVTHQNNFCACRELKRRRSLGLRIKKVVHSQSKHEPCQTTKNPVRPRYRRSCRLLTSPVESVEPSDVSRRPQKNAPAASVSQTPTSVDVPHPVDTSCSLREHCRVV